MPKVTQCLWFARDMEAAVRFYVATVPGSSFDSIATIPAESPGAPTGNMQIVEFTLGGQSYMAFEAQGPDRFNHSFSIMVECDTQAEIDRLWDALQEGGGAGEACGWLKDRWGVSWQIAPAMLGRAMKDADRAKAKRVAEAMLDMVKLDLAELERAAAGN
jgi:predicted 3-demethylubiquinone-9 3-methyltransferase (glyoxalase superfamily)